MLFKKWHQSIIGRIEVWVHNKNRYDRTFTNKVRKNRVTWNIWTLSFLKDEATREGYTGRDFYDKVARGLRHWNDIMKLFDDDED